MEEVIGRRTIAVAVLVSACNTPMMMTGTDAGPPPPDAGPPVCEGTEAACESYGVAECDTVPGCSSESCAGTTPLCTSRTDQFGCYEVRGCRWDMGLYCTGTALGCSAYRGQLECEGVGCTWSSGAACAGTARPCASLNRSECVSASGCQLVSPDIDAGADAGTGDAGMDAGGVCDPSTGDECHAYYDASCGCEYSTSDARWACGRAGSVGEGGSCDDFGVCRGGLYCHRASTSIPGICRRRCADDGDCAAGSACALDEDDTFGAPCTGFCLPLAECSFTAQDCGSGEGCYVLVDPGADRDHLFCHPEGNVAAFANCYSELSIACQAGLFCVQHPIYVYEHNCQPPCDDDSDCDILGSCSAASAGIMHCE